MGRTAISAALLALLAAGCGGGGHTPSGTGNAAIDATFTALATSVLSGSQFLDPALTVTPSSVLNPGRFPPPVTTTAVVLGRRASDGTTGVTVVATSTFALNLDESGTFTTRVTEAGTGFLFLEYDVIVSKPVISLRAGPLAFAGLKPDGTGQAIVVLRSATLGMSSRTFANTNPANGNSLVSFGSNPVPPATLSGAGSAFVDTLVEYAITRDAATSALVAKIVRIPGSASNAADAVTFTRDGSPATEPLSVAFAVLALNGTPVDTRGDIELPIGNDADPAGGFPPDARVTFTALVSGGVAVATGATLTCNVVGPVTPTAQTDSRTVDYAGAFAGLDKVNDGVIEFDKTLSLLAQSYDGSPVLDHSVDGAFGLPFRFPVNAVSVNLKKVQKLSGALYVPSFANLGARVDLFR